jgi:hypothetical protein
MTVNLVISLPKTPYIHTVYDRKLGDFPAKNTTYTPYMTVDLVISLPKTPHIPRIYMMQANPIYLEQENPKHFMATSRRFSQLNA